MKRNILLAITFILYFLLTSCGNGNSDLEGVDVIYNENSGNTFENLFNIGLVAYDKENIYYTVFDDSIKTFCLCKSDLKGTNKSVLINANAQSINVMNGWIYYINPDDKYNVYRIDINGKENQKISQVSANFIYTQDDKLYVKGSCESYENIIFIMDTDGNNAKMLSEQQIRSFYLYEDFIYYTKYAPNSKIQYIGRMRHDGSENNIIIECLGGVDWFTIIDNNLFYINSGSLVKMSLISEDQNKIAELGDVLSSYTINICQKKLYYFRLTNSLLG